MKVKILILALLFMVLPAVALTVSESSSVDYMRANGYSEDIINTTQASKAAINGERYVSFDEQKYGNCSKFTKWVRKFFSYIDPAYEQEDILKHDIKMTPSVYDL